MCSRASGSTPPPPTSPLWPLTRRVAPNPCRRFSRRAQRTGAAIGMRSRADASAWHSATSAPDAEQVFRRSRGLCPVNAKQASETQMRRSVCLRLALCLSFTFWPQLSRERGEGHPAATPLQAQLAAPRQEQALDLLFEGGMIVDGSGASPTRADLGVRGDRIAFIGHARKAGLRAARIIRAEGLIVAPGFIDPHTHAGADLSDPQRRSNLNYLMQGVTTVIVGNDGGGSPEVAQALRQWEEQGIGTNVGVLVGHGAVRQLVLGSGDVELTADQLEQMKALVRKAMGEGALGLSTGLFYVPGAFAKTEEVIELAKVAAALGGVYDSHMRDEDSYSIGLLASIAETIRIGREAKIPVHISHIKALGPRVWGKSAEAIALIRRARAEGIDVTADQYPYIASGSNLVASLMPHWAGALSRERLLALFDDATQLPR